MATADVRALYTFADIDEQARDSDEPFSGYLSVVVTEVNLLKLHLRNMAMCEECCGVSVFANKPTVSCKQCNGAVRLRLNPRVVGPVIDETGCVGAGKLIWSEEAWRGLFGVPIEELVRLESSELKRIEQGVSFARVTLVFGWAEQVGKLVVGRVVR